MESDLTSSGNKELERTLRGLQPASLEQDFLERLEAAAEGQLVALDESELRFERALRSHTPSVLDGAFLEQLEKVVADVPFPMNEKIVLFPKTAPLTRPAASQKINRPMWAAAAAVALIGATTALLVPGRAPSSTGRQVAERNQSGATRQSPLAQDSSSYSPYIMKTEFSDAKDEGVSWHQANQPHRVLRTNYIDRYTMKTQDGRTVVVEQPRTEYILVPEKMD